VRCSGQVTLGAAEGWCVVLYGRLLCLVLTAGVPGAAHAHSLRVEVVNLEEVGGHQLLKSGLILSPLHFAQSQIVISKTRSLFNSSTRPVQKSNGEWRLTVDCRGLNEVTLPLSAAMLDMLELQHQLESKAAKWYATTDITMGSPPSLWQQSAGHSLLSLGGTSSTPGIDCPRGGNTVPPFAMG